MKNFEQKRESFIDFMEENIDIVCFIFGVVLVVALYYAYNIALIYG